MTNITPTTLIDFRSDLVVTGENPEMADLDNPSGYEYGERFYVFAEFEDGSRFAHGYGFLNDPEGAERLATKIIAKGVIDLDTHWHSTDARYGSEAWQRQDAMRHAEHLASPQANHCREY